MEQIVVKQTEIDDLVSSWVPKEQEEEDPKITRIVTEDVVLRPARLGLGAKFVPQSKVLSDVERGLKRQLRKTANDDAEEIIPKQAAKKFEDDEDESRSKMAKKTTIAPAPTNPTDLIVQRYLAQKEQKKAKNKKKKGKRDAKLAANSNSGEKSSN
jgi:hypothetical protein